jgi:hypothetical protein
VNACHALIEYGPRFMAVEKTLWLSGPEASPQVEKRDHDHECFGQAFYVPPQRPSHNPSQVFCEIPKRAQKLSDKRFHKFITIPFRRERRGPCRAVPPIATPV